jgi:predicted nucleotidyltransferase
MKHPVGLITLSGYQIELQEMLKKKVDLATEGGLSDEFYKIIKQDLRLVYEAN